MRGVAGPPMFAVFAGFFPRIADIILWIARPNQFLAPFDGNWIWPLLGIIFLPFATLMYVLFFATGGTLGGWEWFWVVIAGLLDPGADGSHVVHRRAALHLPEQVVEHLRLLR